MNSGNTNIYFGTELTEMSVLRFGRLNPEKSVPGTRQIEGWIIMFENINIHLFRYPVHKAQNILYKEIAVKNKDPSRRFPCFMDIADNFLDKAAASGT